MHTVEIIYLDQINLTFRMIFSLEKIDTVTPPLCQILPPPHPPAIKLQSSIPLHIRQTTSLLPVLPSVVGAEVQLPSVVEAEVQLPVLVISQDNPPIRPVVKTRLSLAVLVLIL